MERGVLSSNIHNGIQGGRKVSRSRRWKSATREAGLRQNNHSGASLSGEMQVFPMAEEAGHNIPPLPSEDFILECKWFRLV